MENNRTVWSRPRYQRTVQEAHLQYHLFGHFDVLAEIPASEFNTNGLPQGFDIQLRQNAPGDLNPFTNCNEASNESGLDNALALRVSDAPQVLSLEGAIPDPPDLEYLRDCIGVLSYFAKAGGVAMYDELLNSWYEVSDWVDLVFIPMAPVPRHHVVICIEKGIGNEGRVAFTKGMKKFARPDIRVQGVDCNNQEAVVDLCDRFVEHQAFGMVVESGRDINMTGFPKGTHISSQPPDFVPKLNNRCVDIVFPSTQDL